MKPAVAKLDALTGLRFLAAFAVFFHHFGTRFHFFETHAPIGGQAVSFFFVLSGFILTYVYHGRLKKGGVKRFYFTRWARIWPLHAVCLLLVIYLLPSRPTFEAPFEQIKVVSHWLLLQSWVPMKDWIFCLNGVSWSISTEMFFYLMFPLLLLGGQRSFWKKYIGIVVFTLLWVAGVKWLATMPSVTGVITIKELVHINPAFRLLEFATGMGAGFLFLNRSAIRKPRSFWVDTTLETVTLVVAVGYDWFLRYALVYHWVRESWWGGNEVVTAMVYSGGLVFFCPMVYVFARSNGFWSRLVSTRLMVYLGEISFAFYMVHQLVLQLIAIHFWTGSTLSPIWAMIGAALVSVGASAVLYAVVEIPMKSGLLKLYDRKPLQALLALVKPVGKFATSRVCLTAILLIIIPTVYMRIERKKDRHEPTVEKIVNRTPPRFREMQFGANASLMGWSIEARRDGLQLNLVWRKEEEIAGEEFTRLIHLVGDDKRPEVTLKRPRFMKGKWQTGDLWVERVFIRNHRYRNKTKIDIELLPSTAEGSHRHARRQLLVNEVRLSKVIELSTQTKLR